MQAHTDTLSSIIDNVKCRLWISDGGIEGARENVVAWGYMPSAIDQQRLELEEIKAEHGLTEKQARFVQATVESPEAPVLTRALNAGYSRGAAVKASYRALRAPKLKPAIQAVMQKRGNLKLEMEKLEENPRAYLKERFLENAADEKITAVQHASLEAIAKLDGLYTQKIELDVGDKTRASWIMERLRKTDGDNLLAQPSQENT